MDLVKLNASKPALVGQKMSVISDPSILSHELAHEHVPVVADWSGHTWRTLGNPEIALAKTPLKTWTTPAENDWTFIKSNARRDVWRAEIGGRSYFVKYFFADGWLRELRNRFWQAPWESEWASGVYAARYNIPAVQPVAFTSDIRRDGRNCAVLITAACEPSQPLNEFWRTLQSDPDLARRRADANQILERLAQLIARAHQAGFEHTDMHAANILVQTIATRRYRCVFVDLQSARMNAPIGDGAVVRNLAQLNQWFRKNSPISDRIRFLRAYFRARNELETSLPHARPLGMSFDQLIHELAHRADHHAQKLWDKRDRRLFKGGRYFSTVKAPDGFRGSVYLQTKTKLDESPASQHKLSKKWWRETVFPAVQKALSNGTAESRKDSHSAHVARVDLPLPDGGSLRVIAKQPRPRNWKRAITLALPPTRSRRGWRIGNGLLHRDVPTARTLGYFEKRVGPIAREQLLLVEEIEHAVDLEKHLQTAYEKSSAREWHAHKRMLAMHLQRLLRRNEDRRVFHRDCKASNILWVTRPVEKLLWIDLDGIRLRNRPLTEMEILRPLVRLYLSVRELPGITRTDAVRFLKNYFSRYDTGPNAWRSILRKMQPLIAEKERAAAKRKSWKLKHYNRT